MPKIYYGEQTKKALKNFPFSARPTALEFIFAIAEIKKAAAAANFQAGNISQNIKNAIVAACDMILSGKYNNQFILPALQGGAGTSINTNVNEVIATLATEILQKRGKVTAVHPNDQVNRSQSTNDVNPSALKIASVKLAKDLLETLNLTVEIFEQKAKQFKNIAKLGRTHLQDAVPTTLGAEFFSYAATIKRDMLRLKQTMPYFLELNLGGTAIGSKVNASPKYIKAVYKELKKNTGLQFKPAENLMSQTSNQTDFAHLSQVLTLLTMDLSKIANDLRIMSSGPNGGLGEISMPDLQAGSSIMPGKINPILPEAINQLFFWVAGNALSIQHAAQAAQLELGVMGPTIADSLIMSLKLSNEVIKKFAQGCVAKIKANPKRCAELLEKSTAFAALLTPKLGYDRVSEIVKQAVAENKTLRQVVLENKILTAKEFDRLVKI